MVYEISLVLVLAANWFRFESVHVMISLGFNRHRDELWRIECRFHFYFDIAAVLLNIFTFYSKR